MGIGTSPGPEDLKLICAEVSLEIWKEVSKQMPSTFPNITDAIDKHVSLYFKILDNVFSQMIS
jgi:hypothetical protein